MKARKKVIIFALCALAMISGTALAFQMLWFRDSSLLVLNKAYSAELIEASLPTVFAGGPIVTTWENQPNSSAFQIAICVTEMSQITQGILTVMNSSDIPTYLSLNISSVDVWVSTGSELYLSYNLALDVALGTEIAIYSSDGGNPGRSCLWDAMADPTKRRSIVVTLSCLQIGSSEGVSSLPLDFVVELGISSL